ncbi:hypothetical protein AA313_de0206626 [Arthrobotrys entomopaga]|nr:hypothetical protein AA313_de0206626 [Arthrobotrys entomopaga]
MRFSVILGTLATLTAVAAVPAAAPSDDKLTKTIYLKDIDPKAPNGEQIIGQITITPNSTVATEARLKKRQGNTIIYGTHWHQCNNPAPHWIPQWQLYAAIPGMCNWLDGNWQIGWGARGKIWWQNYQDSNGNWPHFYDQDYSTNIQTKWQLWTPSWRGWDWNDCYNTIFQMIWVCPGANPDTAGGFLSDYDQNDWSAQLDIYDL